jgi:Protein of unknown function (DUF2867)
LKLSESDFLSHNSNCWTARRAPGFSVLNVHMAEIAAPPERLFPELAAHDLLVPGGGWRLLFGFRAALGKLFGWDRGVRSHAPEPLEVGRHYVFFHIDHVNAPNEVGMSVKNRLTDALMSWVLVADGAGGTRVFNVTCANFSGVQGRVYWQVIRPFHDGIIESSLALLRRRVCGGG